MSMETDVDGDFSLHRAVQQVTPKGTKVISAETWGFSAWAKTAKISTELAEGKTQRYFLKCASGKSAAVIHSKVPGFVPEPVGKGEFIDENGNQIYFYLQKYHDMDVKTPPSPAGLAGSVAELHTKVTSPNGKFGYPIVTGRGSVDRTEQWSDSWAHQFTYLLKDLIKLDNQVNGPWPEFDAACKQLMEGVIPRLLGVLQSEGRSIAPALCHGDLWEGNVATDLETGKVIIFDPDECMYAHNEIEFGTWRCRWATHFKSPAYIQQYQMLVPPSEPVEEWDDRNRLYSIKAAICDSAGHRGSKSRAIAYNDMLFLCEKYAPLESLEPYDPEKDTSVTGIAEAYNINAGL